jgi:hypothetical protein
MGIVSMIENAGAKEQGFVIWVCRDKHRPACMSKCIGNKAWVIGQIIGKNQIQEKGICYDHAGRGDQNRRPASCEKPAP